MRSLHRVMAVTAAGIAAATTLIATGPAANAVAKPESQTFLSVGATAVKTTTGQHLLLSLSADRFSSNTAKSDADSPGTVTVNLTDKTGVETHSWTFPVSKGSFTTDASGTGVILTGKQLTPFGSLKLGVKTTGSGTKVSCGAGNYEVVHKAKVKGSISFVTESEGKRGWGDLAKQSVKFAPGTITGSHGPDAEEGCSGLGEQKCIASTDWSATSRAITISGSSTTVKGVQHTTLEGSRFVPLSKPKQATRFDEVLVKAPPLVVSSGSKPTLTIDTSGKVATGSATIAAKTHNLYTIDCKGGEETGHSWTGTYTPGHVAISLHETAFAAITMSKAKNAFFSKVTA